MVHPFATVGCGIEVYPFEGGPYFISSGQIKSLTTTKTLRGGSDGVFSISLAPGGPFGPESVPDWTEIITPGSHVLIGMQRGDDSAIVMDGVVTTTSENQQWHSSDGGSTATRSPVISGSDFTWFFNSQNWYSLAMYGLTLNSGLQGQFGLAPASIIPFIAQGMQGQRDPAIVGNQWFQVMTASGIGMLNNTFVPYKGGNTRLPFNSMFTENLEHYPNVIIPITEQFLGLESWMAKFMDIFPWPWYEFFVTTAPTGVYALSGSSSSIFAAGTVFSMQAFSQASPAGPQMVARVTPIPRLDFVKEGSNSNYSVGALDMSRWNALPITTLSGVGFYESNVAFSSDEVKNFYYLNPTAYRTVFNSPGSNVPFQFTFGGAADPASVHRYGYRPVNGTLRWFLDPQGTVAASKDVDIYQTVATLTAALVSWWHPLPLMARAEVAIPLAPSIYIGTRFEYAPFKDGIPWTFYVEGVTQRYVFGGRSETVLALSRGLPSSVYADSSASGLLQAIYTGNARRQYLPGESGIYKIGLLEGTGKGLQVFSSFPAASNLAQQMWSGFVTPQVASP